MSTGYYVRWKIGESFTPRRFELSPTDASVVCPACGEVCNPGDAVSLIPLGPGADVEARERTVEQRWTNAVAVLVHFACATGEQ